MGTILLPTHSSGNTVRHGNAFHNVYKMRLANNKCRSRMNRIFELADSALAWQCRHNTHVWGSCIAMLSPALSELLDDMHQHDHEPTCRLLVWGSDFALFVPQHHHGPTLMKSQGPRVHCFLARQARTRSATVAGRCRKCSRGRPRF